MIVNRSFVLATLIAVASGAVAQINGPAPLAWRWQQSSPVSPTGSPIVDGNTIFMNLGNRVYSIDRATGNTNWKFPNGAPLDGYLKRSPIMIGDTIVVATETKKVYGINSADGSLKWVHDTPQNVYGAPVAVGKYVAFSMGSGQLDVLDVATGNSVYTDPYTILDGITSPLNSNGRDSVLFFDSRNRLRSVNVVTRSSNWSQTFTTRPSDSSVEVSGNTIYAATSTNLVALSLESGSPKWSKPIPERIPYAPEVSGGKVAIVGPTGNLLVFSESGQQLTKKAIALGAPAIAKATIVGSKVAVPLANGAFALANPETGTTDWLYYVRPMNEAAKQTSGATGGGPRGGGGLGGPSGGGAPGGLGGFGGQGGSGAGGQTNTTEVPVTVPLIGRLVSVGSSLLVAAADASVLSFDTENGVDITSPTVKGLWPPAGELIAGTQGQEFLFQIDDDSSGVNPNSLTVTIDGKKYNHEFGKDGLLTVRISRAQKNDAIPNGRHELKIVVSDWLGNTTTHIVNLRIDNSLPVYSKQPSNQNGPGGPGGGGPRGGGGGLGGLGGGDGTP